jgi:hypothetical protein
MHTVRTIAAALVLAATGLAQAAEYTEFPLEKSILTRAEVRADARHAPTMPGELYDGSVHTMPAVQAMKSRDAVRQEARVAIRVMDPVMFNDRIGG